MCAILLYTTGGKAKCTIFSGLGTSTIFFEAASTTKKLLADARANTISPER
jgi:hypothetical protein